MPDAIISELWRVKDAMAREHGYDVKALAAYLRRKEQSRRTRPAKPTAARSAGGERE